MNSSLSYCGKLVRERDPDRFLTSLFAPAGRREDLWALFAFNHEIAKTREVVSETATGQLRLQWWREEIEKLYNGAEPPENEVLKALKAAVGRHALPRDLFETLIYAREFDLENVPPATIEGFLHYADFTSTPLMKMAVIVTGGDAEYEPVQVVAVNYALIGLLRAVRFHAGQRRCYLPDDLMKRHGVSQRQLFDFLKPEEGLKDVVRVVAGQFVHGIRPGNKFLRATQALADIHYRQIARRRFDCFDPRLAIPPAFKELRVFAALAGARR